MEPLTATFTSLTIFGGGLIDVFGPEIAVPEASTSAASGVLPTSATLNGHLDPAGGGEVTACHFEYVTDTSFQSGRYTGASTVPCSEGNSFSTPSNVHANLTGLLPETTYHFRLVVASATSGSIAGTNEAFTTPPAVAGLSTEPATNITAVSAGLHGSFTGNGEDTHCYFEYGTEAGVYGSNTSSPPGGDAGMATGKQAFTENAIGLTPETTYHFRIVCTNGSGTTTGPDQTFVTVAAVALFTGQASSILDESVTLNGSINPQGQAITDCHFEYAHDSDVGRFIGTALEGIGYLIFGHSVPCEAPSALRNTQRLQLSSRSCGPRRPRSWHCL